RLVRLFFELIQSDAGRYPRRRTHRDCLVALALVAGIRSASLVRVEISKFHCLVDRTFLATADLFTFPKTHRRRTALFRSHTVAALDDVDLIFWFDCGFDLRNASGAARSEQARCAISRSWPGRDLSIGSGD